ncbi:MAG: NUDIX domain-containing protein [Balneolaceae bacterium]|nr:MAG: NUDIX domain-containing protein [Balneolaceae bacterium]
MATAIYENILRNRACAIIMSDNWILLAKQRAPTRKGPIWMPPGGGLIFGETLQTALKREVFEETGLLVEPGRLLWIHEFIEKPYHAIEFYFECSVAGGALKLGRDPERDSDDQILLDLKFISFKELASLNVYPRFLKNGIIKDGKMPFHLTHVISDAGV